MQYESKKDLLEFIYKLPLDWRVRDAVYALNKINGVQTGHTCSGHIEIPKSYHYSTKKFFLNLEIKAINSLDSLYSS